MTQLGYDQIGSLAVAVQKSGLMEGEAFLFDPMDMNDDSVQVLVCGSRGTALLAVLKENALLPSEMWDIKPVEDAAWSSCFPS